MKKDARVNLTIDELIKMKNVLEREINDSLTGFEKRTGLPVVDIDVDIHYPVEVITKGGTNQEPNFSRTIDVCIAL